MSTQYQAVASNIKPHELRPEPLEVGLYLSLAVILPLLLAFFFQRKSRFFFYFSWFLIAVIGFNYLYAFLWVSPFFRSWPLAVATFAFLAYKKPDLRKVIRWFDSQKARTLGFVIFTFLLFGLRMLALVFTDVTVGPHSFLIANVEYTSSEFYAPLLKLIPYFNFEAQYTKVLNVLFSPIFYIFGTSTGVFTFFCALLTTFIFYVCYQWIDFFWKNSILTKMLWIFVFSFTLFPVRPNYLLNSFTYYAVGPLRYFGVFLVAYFLLRFLKKEKGAFILGIASALTFFNNLDFGLPATVGASVALCLASFKKTPIFLAGAAIFSILYFGALSLWIGQPPFQEASFFEFQRAFAILGVYMMPMPAFGLHVPVLAIAPIIVVWTGSYWFLRFKNKCKTTPEESRRMAGLLFFAITTIGSSMYYVGRSHDAVLPALFLFFALNAVLFLRETLRYRHQPNIQPLFILSLMFVAVLPPQVANIRNPFTIWNFSNPSFAERIEKLETWVQQNIPQNSHSMFLIPFGNRIAVDTGRKNLSPYVESGSILLQLQLEKLISKIEKEKPSHFLHAGLPELTPELRRMGYLIEKDESSRFNMLLWVRTKPPEPSDKN